MKLIVEISDTEYKLLINNSVAASVGSFRFAEIIKNATPLEESEDCVSRQRVVEWLHNCTDDSIEHAIDSNLEFIPPVTPKQTFEGMTNGEVIKALFPYVEAEETPHLEVIETNLDQDFAYTLFQKKWWNTPYKASPAAAENEVNE